MARVTVEDCLDNVENRFELVMLATRRARQLYNGKEALVPLENDKPTVVALREIAEGKITTSILDAQDAAEAKRALEAEFAEEIAEVSDDMVPGQIIEDTQAGRED